MNAAPYWIQSSDFSHKDFPAAAAHEIEHALKTHDWAGEEDRQTTLKNSGAEQCDAGLGVMVKDGRRLIIRPDRNERCEVEYSFFEPDKILGVIPKRKYHAGELTNIPLEEAARLIAPFLANNYAVVKMEIEARK